MTRGSALRSALPDELEKFVDLSVRSGKYRSRDEVIQVALCLLRERERKVNALRDDVQVGLDQLDCGEGQTLEDAEAVDDFFAQIKSEGRSLHQRKRARR